MKVFHIQKASGVSGSERHLLTLLPGLIESGLDVRMLVLAAADYRSFVDRLTEAGIEVDVLPAGMDINPFLVSSIRRVAERFRPDIIHTHLLHADLYGQIAARTMGVCGVRSLHATHDEIRRFPFRNAAKLAGRLSRRTIAISEHVKRFALDIRIVDPGAIDVVRYGIDVARWSSSPDPGARLRRELGVRDEETLIGVASRLVPDKGHDILIRAVGQALGHSARLRLVVMGDGPLRSQLEQFARDETGAATTFTGYVTDVRPYLSACDVVAFPTQPGFGEGFGLAALEAMASSRPVLATAIDSLPEIVIDGETGILVPPGDVVGLTGALLRLAEDRDLRRRMGTAGKHRAEESFSVERMVHGTVSCYEAALGSDLPSRSL